METTHCTSEATSGSIVDTNVMATNNRIFNVSSITVINQQIKSLNDITDKNKSPKNYKAEQLRILVINFQSIRNKKEEFSLLLSENDIDIVLGSETHLNEHIFDSEFMHPAYTCYRRDNDGNDGAIIITKKELIVEEECNVETYQFVAVKIETDNQHLILATAYRSPNSTINETLGIYL